MADEITDLTRRYRLQVNLGTAVAPDFQTVLGMVEFKPAVEPEIKEDTDYETDGWKGQTKTLQGWEVEAKISHKYDPDTLAYHPTHVKLEAASEAFGAASRVQVRYFDRFGKGSGRRGWALVTWTPEGGDAAELDRVTVKLAGDGPLEAITNPLNETPLPVVTGVSPAGGGTAGGTLVVITGSAFTGASAVAFGATAATSYQVVSATKIAAIAPARTAGSVQVKVTTPNGISADTSADDFLYA
ncbi:phage tail tube protein [Actinomadura macra]|uniref:phage tail tube protein n=1 Tax=Actinomadura macra TaxID=46164 RepID=UPI000830EF70|nr:IPT/TIG domain-containing protein [Actinomadura macra]